MRFSLLGVVCRLLGVAALLTGCATVPRHGGVDAPLLASAVDREALAEAFAVCHGYGCAHSRLIGLDDDESAALLALFTPPSTDAADERSRVARAVALMERAAGWRLGTSADLPRTPPAMGDSGQLDCVDESINTSTYLHLFDRLGLLRWHRIGEPARRYRFLHFGVHYTAVLVERESGVAWAVDAWFHANGVPAEIVELTRWRAGWAPQRSIARSDPPVPAR